MLDRYLFYRTCSRACKVDNFGDMGIRKITPQNHNCLDKSDHFLSRSWLGYAARIVSNIFLLADELYRALPEISKDMIFLDCQNSFDIMDVGNEWSVP